MEKKKSVIEERNGSSEYRFDYGKVSSTQKGGWTIKELGFTCDESVDPRTGLRLILPQAKKKKRKKQ